MTNRHAILHLLAMGRISPTEAERLLVAWDSEKEALWAVTALIAVALLEQINLRTMLPALQRVAHSLMSGDCISLHRIFELVTRLHGGAL